MAGTGRTGNAAALRRVQRVAAGTLLGVGVGGLLLFSLGRERSWQAFGGGLVVAGAAAVLGAALGFLFGVPRMRGGDQPKEAGPGAYVPNTNLEQVSDWLTKVLLGVGLTQLGSLGERLEQLGRTLAPVLGGEDGAAPFAAALVLYFLLFGFLAGWLVTRLLLPQVLTDADRALQLFLAGQEQDLKGDKVGADDLRVRAMQHLGLLGGSAERPTEVAGQLAAAQPERVVAEVRSTARGSALTADQVRALFADGSEDRRLQALALMQGDPALADLSSLVDAIEQPRSGFEQYHALLAARGLLSRLPAGQAERLREAVAGRLLARDGIPYGSDRSWLAEKILSRLDTPAAPAPGGPPQEPGARSGPGVPPQAAAPDGRRPAQEPPRPEEPRDPQGPREPRDPQQP